MTLREYLDFLEERKLGNPPMPEEALNYVFVDISIGNLTLHRKLDFVRTLPKFLAGKIDQARNSQFYLGGTFMGAPMHFHGLTATWLRSSFLFPFFPGGLRPPPDRGCSHDPSGVQKYNLLNKKCKNQLE